MKFYGAILAYLMIGALLGWAILQAVHGSYWFLGFSVFAYVVAFATIGCLPPKKSH